jgi:hypothetical protein
MPATSPEITERFNRQRRNLIVVSILLLFSQFAGGLTLKEINVFGNKTELGNPIEIETILWVGFTYLLWRYYQYFHYSEDKGTVVGEFFLRRQIYLKATLGKFPVYKNWIRETYTDKPIDGKKIKDIQMGNIDIHKQLVFSSTVKLKSMDVEYEDGSRGHHLGGDSYEITARYLIIPNLRSMFYVIFRTPLFTEYYFPFVVAGLPIINIFF